MKPLLAALCALGLAACATTQRIDAGMDVHEFLVSVRDNDRATFERHIDRDAIERQIEARMIAEFSARTSSDSGRVLGALLGAPLAQIAGDALVRPSVFRSIAVALGYSPERPIPNSLIIAKALRYQSNGEVCAPKKNGECLLIFVRTDGVWRLTRFAGEFADLKR